MKRILITGASGFIGGWLVDEALRRGYEVWAGVRRNSSLKNLTDSKIHLITLDYDNVETLMEQLRPLAGWDYVIHNAGITKTLNYNDFYRVNALYTKNLAEALVKVGCKPDKFLLMSSLSVYGPIRDTIGGMICESDKPQPDTHYGKSKLMAERYLKERNDLAYIILKPTGVYGPGDKDYLMQINSIRRGFDMQVGYKPQKITFIYVKDLARAAFDALESEVKNASFIVSDGDIHSADDFSDEVKALYNRRLVLKIKIPLWLCRFVCCCSERYGRLIGKPQTLNSDKYKILRQRNWSCDAKPIEDCLGFRPAFDLKKGLKETIFLMK